MTIKEKKIKRIFDVLCSCIGLIILGWFILVVALLSKILIRGHGFFTQKRIGEDGELFSIYKIETIHPLELKNKKQDIKAFGRFLRRYKIDEFPQLWNVLEGTMSFVGPRPDLPGFADKLEGEARIILNVKPGITGPASLYFRNEEQILKNQNNPEKYNMEVIWPKKIELNIAYIKDYNFFKDIGYLLKTLFLKNA